MMGRDQRQGGMRQLCPYLRDRLYPLGLKCSRGGVMGIIYALGRLIFKAQSPRFPPGQAAHQQ